jgi:23S rRNA (adenine2030-N6)-methyltransferase
MQFRHSFHAGNFADVHKHVTLLALLAAMQKKDGGLLYLETHAGAGLYDLAHPKTEASRASQSTLAELMAAAPAAAELQHYLSELARLRTALNNPGAYPGSPLLAAAQLRPQDRAVLLEIVPSAARALKRALQGYPHTLIEEADGFARLRAFLPPRERRCLVLIDPPYEESTDFESVAAACKEALRRLHSAVIAAWYPIKDARTTNAWLARLAGILAADSAVAEWWLYPRDSRVALNGSGLLILNPPYQFAARMRTWLAELHEKFPSPGAGGVSVRTVNEPV